MDSEEFWLHGGEESERIESIFEFTFGGDHRIELRTNPRRPVGRIPLNNFLDISVAMASASVDTTDYDHLIELVTPLLVYQNIRPEVFPKVSDDTEWCSLEAGGEARDFPNCDTLEQRLQLLVNKEQEQAHVEDWDPSEPHTVCETAPSFQYAYGALEHLWSRPCQVSVQDYFQNFTELTSVKRLLFANIKSSVENAAKYEAFEIALILVFEKLEGGLLIVFAASGPTGQSVQWECSDSVQDMENSMTLNKKKRHNEIFQDLKTKQFLI